MLLLTQKITRDHKNKLQKVTKNTFLNFFLIFSCDFINAITTQQHTRKDDTHENQKTS